MIIIEIGHDKFLIESLEEAQFLIDTLDKAKKVDYSYIDVEGETLKKHYYEADGDHYKGSLVSDCKIHTKEEIAALRMRAEDLKACEEATTEDFKAVSNG